jgi:L-threonylcarbamoyladenylate synthase
MGKPIVSTSANISGDETPLCFSEIKNSILEGVDHVVNLQKEKTTSVPSTIYKIEDNGEFVIIRK